MNLYGYAAGGSHLQLFVYKKLDPSSWLSYAQYLKNRAIKMDHYYKTECAVSGRNML